MKTDRYLVNPGSKVDLAKMSTHGRDHSDITKDAALAELALLTARLTSLQELLYAEGTRRVLVVLQATDTGGKDGVVRGVFGPLNPQGVWVTSFKAPTEIELAHDYLWRAHSRVPADGELVIFNRSHYEDVLIARVQSLVPEKRWRKRYRHIRDFEAMLVDEGTTIIKVFLHISKDEQKARLQARLDEPTKHWKFNAGDLVEREKWDEYQSAYEDALAETSAPHAPWYVIPSDRKWFRNLVIAHIMVDLLESLGMAYPSDPEGLEGYNVT
jgi:PPK2 family polyphosphate:nucleotide phosphotransferase